MTATVALTGRDRAILRAVADGHAELTSTADLLLDGRYCCDQHAAGCLVRAGLIAPTGACAVGQRVAATVTPAGHAQLEAAVDVPHPTGAAGHDPAWTTYLASATASAREAS